MKLTLQLIGAWFVGAMLHMAVLAHAQILPQAEITWSYIRVAPETGFSLERKLGPIGSANPWVKLPNINPGINSVIDATILSNTEYCYRLSAFNATGSSAWSNTACGTSVKLAVPSIPAITLKMSQVIGKPTTLTVSFNAPPKPSKKDWMGLYLATATDRQFILTCGGQACWKYTDGELNPSLTVTPPAAGTYNVRYLLNDGFTSVMQSYDVTVK